MQTFEEFQAVQIRRRAKPSEVYEERNNGDGTKENIPVISLNERERQPSLKSPEKRKDSPFLNVSSIVKTIGRRAESDEVQIAILFLLFFDLVASSGLLVVSHWNDGSDEIATSFICKLLHSVTIFTLISFLLELVVLLVSFGKKFFQHKGYVLDTFVVLTCLFTETYSSITQDSLITTGKEVRLIGFVRVWRIIRVVETIVGRTSRQEESTKSELEKEWLKTEELLMSLELASKTSKREMERRRQVEKMLQEYKEEVDVLNEALKLAAHEIASSENNSATQVETQQNEDGLFPQLEVEMKKQAIIEIDKDGSFYEKPFEALDGVANFIDSTMTVS